MPKTIDSTTASHLAAEVTALCTCWKITRRDGRSFRFTSLDRNIEVLGELYLARTGYDRTALSSSSAAQSVDNMDIEGLFDEDMLPQSDIRAGLFDFSEVAIFSCAFEWVDLGSAAGNIVRLKRGFLGEVQATSLGHFKAEFRGLGQKLLQRIGEATSAECRADLGDSRCGVPTHPDVILRSTAYGAGDYVRVPTLLYGITPVALPVGNFDDYPDPYGWSVVQGVEHPRGTEGSLNAFTGDQMLMGAMGDSPDPWRIEQTISLADVVGVDLDALDEMRLALSVKLYRATADSHYAGHDAGRFRIETASDANCMDNRLLWSTGWETILPTSMWSVRGAAGLRLLAGTRYVRLICEGVRNGDRDQLVMAAFDGITAEITESPDPFCSDVYENLIYRCTTAGTTSATLPDYNATAGQSTTDGTAVFIAEQAWTRAAEVTAVTDNGTFTVACYEPRVPTSLETFFNYGLATWELGLNRASTMEVKSYAGDENGGEVTLFLPMSRTVTVGDRITLTAGCNKRFNNHCRNKFDNAVNFRGEPYLPGRDWLGRYPDAK